MNIPQQIDAADYRNALGAFTTGVTVVTTRGSDGQDIGLTANSFNSVSLDPPMVLWSLGKSSRSMPFFRQAKTFAVHILSSDQEELSTRFARRGADKFAGLDLQRGPDDVPLLPDCAACFICKTAYQYEGGDHIIFVGEVTGFNHWEREPLLFHRGQYGQLASPETQAPSAKPVDFSEASLGYLLRLCTHQIMFSLKKELAGRGLTICQYHFLASLAKFGPSPLSDLVSKLKYGDSVPSDDEIAGLMNEGLIEQKGENVQLTDKGSKLHMELVAYYKASESAALNALDYEDRQALHISLIKLVETGPH